jgi:glycosyltransferase involved in cell wall biosynthesis
MYAVWIWTMSVILCRQDDATVNTVRSSQRYDVTMAAGRAGFFRTGAFSHTNASVDRVLRACLPEVSWESIDIIQSIGGRWPSQLYLAFAALRHYGPSMCWPPRRALRYGRRTPAYFQRSRELLRRSCSGRSYEFTFQTQSIVDARIDGVPHFVYTDHTQLANLYYPAHRRDDLPAPEWIACERSLYLNATLIFTMSSHVSRSLIEQYGCDPARVVCAYAGPNVPLPALESARPDRFSGMRILFIGKDWQRKGGPQLVAAFDKVRKVYPHAELVIVGCTPKIAADNCRVVGPVPVTEVGRYFEEASVFCMPTRNEPFGLVFIEAFAHELPIVSSQIGALPDIVEEGRSGYLVEADDVDTLAVRLMDLLGDPDKCRRFGAHGRELVKSRYTWENVGRIMSDNIRRHVPALQRQG